MAKTAILSVRILGDAKGAVSAMGEAEGRASKLGGALKGIGGVLLGAATVAGGALVGLGVAGVKAAGNLEQSIGAVDTVFKDQAGVMHGYASTAATTMGLTANEYNELATVMGTQLKNGGTAMEDLGGKTNELMGLGADLASMFGGTTTDAVGALSSALKGERDPIERYGVSLNQAAIDARAAELGFSKTGGALSAQAQQAATLSLIMEQTADAQGNFGRETSTFAGQVAILTSQWGNFVAQVGTLLLPVLTSLLTYVTGSIMPGLQGLADVIGPRISEAIGQVGPMIGQFVSGLTSVTGGASPLRAVLEAVMPAVTGIGSAFLGILPTLMEFGGNVIPLIIGAVSTVVPLIAQAAGTVIPAVIGVVQQLLPILGSIASAVIPAVVGAVQTLIPVILSMVPPIVSIVDSIIGVLGPAVQWLLPLVTGIFGALVTQVKGAIQIITAVLTSVAALLRGDFSGAWEAIQGVVDGAITMVKGIIQQGMTWISSLTGKSIDEIKSTFVNGFTALHQRVVAIVTNLHTSVIRFVGNLHSGIVSRVTAIRNGIVDGFNSARASAVSIITGLVTSVTRFVGNLVSGIVSRVSSIRSAISNGFNAARTLAVTAFTNLVTGVVGRITNLLNTVRQLPSRIRSALGNLGGLLRSAGRDLIQGLINGVGSMGQALRNKASGLAGGAVNAIKSKLGIASPSKVMQQVGVWTGEGFVRGLDRMQRGAAGAMTDLVTVPDAPRLPISARAAGSLAAGGDTYNITINGALDPDATARQIEELLARRARRTGRAVIGSKVRFA